MNIPLKDPVDPAKRQIVLDYLQKDCGSDCVVTHDFQVSSRNTVFRVECSDKTYTATATYAFLDRSSDTVGEDLSNQKASSIMRQHGTILLSTQNVGH